ncbi:50S ribosomal protein L29 [Candidatus Hecatella orcuttiae]|jgi:large subunit ribosomal protein L29|uniref:50S ribosomal protein L29 n=1 Tax=Candidatus Hecatella orcuttiae TaxID=1935119 RepID=UPI002867EF88|nr:50S ribosomal protein L29 [Candidatus Hecatella orcuttiae]
MPILRMKDIRSMSKAEREKKLAELRVELMKLRSTLKARGKVENPSAVRELRRTIARILTVQREEEIR